MNFKNKAVRATVLVLLLVSMLMLCSISVAADEAENTDAGAADVTLYPVAELEGGYYTIKNSVADKYLTFTLDEDNESEAERISLSADKPSSETVFELIPQKNGTYMIRAVDSEQELYVCYDSDTADVSLTHSCDNDKSDLMLEFNIYIADGGFIITPHSVDTDTVIGTEDALLWSIEKIKVEKITLSTTSIKVKPYVTYNDLRALVTPSYLSECIEWSSSDRGVVIIDNSGKFCALSEGDVTLCASVGSYKVECEVNVSYDNQYAWYSQNNVTTGGWNGGALYNIYFKSNGTKKRFALNNSTKKNDWVSEGCALCSIAQVLNNMGARYTNGYDFRSGISGNIMADPYTVALANTNNKGATSDKATLYGDPVNTSQRAIASRFNVDGAEVTVDLYYNVTKKKIKEALDKSPWGVVVCFENSSYGKHYITFNKCLNPDAKNPNDYIFTVSDPASLSASNAADVIFEKSYSYTRLYYRFSQATLMQVWSYEGYEG